MAKTTSVSDLLKTHAFFRDLRPKLFAELEDIAEVQAFKAGDRLIREGEAADSLFLIDEGTVCLRAEDADGASKVVQTLRDGDLLGWSWIVPPYYWAFDGVAETDVSAIHLDAGLLRFRMSENPALEHELSKRLLVVMAARLRALRMEYLGRADQV